MIPATLRNNGHVLHYLKFSGLNVNFLVVQQTIYGFINMLHMEYYFKISVTGSWGDGSVVNVLTLQV